MKFKIHMAGHRLDLFVLYFDNIQIKQLATFFLTQEMLFQVARNLYQNIPLIFFFG